MAQQKRGSGCGLEFDDPFLDDIILIDQLGPEIWTDGITIRPSGYALAACIETPHLYLIDLRFNPEDPFSRGKPPRIVQEFPDCTSAVNVTRLRGTESEDYAVITAHVDVPNKAIRDVRIYRVSFGPDGQLDPPVLSKIADLPDVIFGFGMVQLSDDVLLVADTTKGTIWRVQISTGEPSILYHDPETTLPLSGEAFCMNRVQVAAGHMWYTNTSQARLYRVPIEYINDGADIKVTGAPQIVAEGCPHNDGLVVLQDGSAAYLSSYVLGNLWRVDVDAETGSGEVNNIVDLVSPTAMQVVYHPEDEKPTLYIASCGAWSEEQLAGERGKWLALTNADRSQMKIRVHITVETTVHYETIA
ncbi:unnamed protein product [Clonostachys rosea]|uniref:SMP-30/Gluconolactonase/LRE-like region domain-containing protein n=1 Tax=Bionectria ochroleuca TaxID=29856 RepID=A0ABY6UC75_BIOOC|nr:unnamed protein product [Clonostachys rosea]